MSKQQILLVEDSKTQAAEIGLLLEVSNYEVIIRYDALTAIDYLNNCSENKFPDLIITDINMPEMDGYEFTEYVKKRYPEMFIVVMTVNKTEEAIQKSFNSGAIDFIIKPPQKTEFAVRIQNILRIRDAENQLKSSQKALAETNTIVDKLTVKDRLTNAFSRKNILREIDNKIYDANRYGQIFSLVVFKLTNINLVNSKYGNKQGDKVITRITEQIIKNARKTDIIGRYSGVTFLLIAPNTDHCGAMSITVKLKKCIDNIKFPELSNLQIGIKSGVIEHKKNTELNKLLSIVENML